MEQTKGSMPPTPDMMMVRAEVARGASQAEEAVARKVAETKAHVSAWTLQFVRIKADLLL
jgi:hypothetical protein